MELNSENTDATPLLDPEEVSPQPTPVLEPEEEQQVPPLSSYWSSVVYWAKQLRYPIFVVGANVASFVLTQVLFYNAVDDMYTAMYTLRQSSPGATDGSEFRSVQMMITVTFAISLFTFLADSYICLQGARRMERKVSETQEQAEQQEHHHVNQKEQQEEAEEISQEDDHFVKMSRSVDIAFGCTSDVPSATFFVCLLWALFSVAVSIAVNRASVLVRVQLTPTTEMPRMIQCFVAPLGFFAHEEGEESIASLQKSPNFPYLPKDVQSWIRMHGSTETIPLFNRSHSYIQGADGTMVFPYSRGQSYSGQPPNLGLAMFSPKNHSVVEYTADMKGVWSSMYDGSSVELVGFPANPPYYGWCGIYKMTSFKILQHEVICYNGNTGQLKQFAPIKDTKESGGGFGSVVDDNLYATEDTLWVATTRNPLRESNRDKSEILTSLVAYDIKTMERMLAADRNATTYEVKQLKPECRNSYLTSFWSSKVAHCVVSLYLYRRDVPSCALPASFTFTSIMNLILPTTWALLVILLSVCNCLYLLVAGRRAGSISKYVTFEMMVWAMYSLFVGSVFGLLWQYGMYFLDWEDLLLHFLLLFGVATAISVLLNHPIFQILGVFCCIGAGFSCLLVFMGLADLLLPVLFLTFSLGCFRVASLLPLYRVHVIVYVRRACRALKRAWSAWTGQFSND